MMDSTIHTGAFVRRQEVGVGKVVAVDGNPSVVFWSNRDSGKTERFPEGLLNLLLDDGPEALLWDYPEELAPWATDKPLPLVALALSFDGGTGRAADVREKLSGRVMPEENWDGWWKKRAKSLGSLAEHFEAHKTAKGTSYTLKTSLHDVPPDWKPAKTRKITAADWNRWLTVPAGEPPPGRFPPKGVCDSLANRDARDIGPALAAVTYGAGYFLATERKPPKRAATAWLEALSEVAARDRELWNRDHLQPQVGGLLAELAGIAGRDKVLRILADAFVAPEDYAAELESLRQTLVDTQNRHADEVERLQRAHAADSDRMNQARAAELETLQQVHEAELEREQGEQERLRQQVRERNAELAANREESRLELRQDMLLAVGEVLQSLHGHSDSEVSIGDVAAGLVLALSAGGAEQLGTVGGVVEFNPEQHQAEKGVSERGRVKIVVPGVIYRGRTHGDRVLLKAQVKHEAG